MASPFVVTVRVPAQEIALKPAALQDMYDGMNLRGFYCGCPRQLHCELCLRARIGDEAQRGMYGCVTPRLVTERCRVTEYHADLQDAVEECHEMLGTYNEWGIHNGIRHAIAPEQHNKYYHYGCACSYWAVDHFKRLYAEMMMVASNGPATVYHGRACDTIVSRKLAIRVLKRLHSVEKDEKNERKQMVKCYQFIVPSHIPGAAVLMNKLYRALL